MCQTKAQRFDVERLCEFVEQKTRRSFEWAHEYAEPGYGQPAAGIVFGNWNTLCSYDAPKEVERRDPGARLARILERLGFELEWEDEWATCHECGKAVRTKPDSYGWTSYYRILNECELICLDCLDVAEYLESIEDNPRQACPPEMDPAEHGYVKHSGTFENGWHPGQNDDPKKILAEMQAAGMKHVVFRLAGAGQFDISFEAYHKPEESDDECRGE
jgi:hypothetical protein